MLTGAIFLFPMLSRHYIKKYYARLCIRLPTRPGFIEMRDRGRGTATGLFVCYRAMYSPAVLRPGLEVNFATSTIFTAKVCPVWRWMHFRTTLNGPLQQYGRDVNNNNYARGTSSSGNYARRRDKSRIVNAVESTPGSDIARHRYQRGSIRWILFYAFIHVHFESNMNEISNFYINNFDARVSR